MAEPILVIGVADVGPAILARLSSELTDTTGIRSGVLDESLSSEHALDPTRNQYNSSLILGTLCGMGIALPRRILGVTLHDLFAPVLTYVFGEAQLNGPSAVVSTYRLTPERYGLSPDPDVLARRLLVESVHELGHTAGLRHCLTPGCAMNGSTYVEDIDLKGPGYCPDCARIFVGSFRDQPV